MGERGQIPFSIGFRRHRQNWDLTLFRGAAAICGRTYPPGHIMKNAYAEFQTLSKRGQIPFHREIEKWDQRTFAFETH
jgi:hypothetical protein